MGRNGKGRRYTLYGDIHGKRANKELEWHLPHILREAREGLYYYSQSLAEKPYEHKNFEFITQFVNQRRNDDTSADNALLRTSYMSRLTRSLSIADYEAANARKRAVKVFESKLLESLLIDALAEENTCVIPSLSSICSKKIGEYLCRFNEDDLCYVLQRMPPSIISTISIYGSYYKTLRNEFIHIFGSSVISTLCIGGYVTDHGIMMLLSSLRASQNIEYQSVDSWEDIDLETVSFHTYHVYLSHLVLYGMSISMSVFQNLWVEVSPFLETFHVHNICLSHSEELFHSSEICDEFLDILSTGSSSSLRAIRITCCSWLVIASLKRWLDDAVTILRTLPNLREIEVLAFISREDDEIVEALNSRFSCSSSVKLSVKALQ